MWRGHSCLEEGHPPSDHFAENVATLPQPPVPPNIMTGKRSSSGQGSLLGCCLWGRTESDTTEAT